MKCPIVTGDAQLNDSNTQKAVEKADYMEAGEQLRDQIDTWYPDRHLPPVSPDQV